MHATTLKRIMLFSLWLGIVSTAQADDRPPAELITFQGTAEVRATDDANWQPARHKHPLPALSSIRTGNSSWASLLFIDQTQIKLSANTLFQVKEARQSGKGQTLLELRKGKAWMQSKTPPKGLTVQTPAANAGIQGTDWVIDVDSDGKTSLSVLSGEVVFANAQGKVLVGKGEEAVATPGTAPLKQTLVNPRERVQWVSTHGVRWERYPELLDDPASKDIVVAVKENRTQDALSLIRSHPAWPAAALSLLEADLLQGAGALEAARQGLTGSMNIFSTDSRFSAALALLELSMDNAGQSLPLVDEALRHHPQDAELWLAKGEIARWQGNYPDAAAAFSKAQELAPADPRGWRGRGLAASEREDFTTGRQHFAAALERSPGWTEALAELGWLETLADDLPMAQKRFAEALAIDPNDYVALTGLGYLTLKTGQPEAALRHLLAANTIEPRYARAVQTMAIAYYQLGQLKAALDCLTRAAELDERDPMPWFLKSLIQQDHWQTGAAILSAREGMARLPYLKSMNQLATDLQGAANLGSAYAQFGMEDWAMRAAQESYDPFWAGSHFFLANRYAGEFLRNSELTLGFLTDPTAFGTTGRWQPLVPTPGIHGRASSWLESGGQSRIMVPGLTMNGYHNTRFPVAWFAEGQLQLWQDDGFSAKAIQVPLGLGMKPSPDWRFFLFANSFRPDIDRHLSGGNQSISGDNKRVDFGTNYRHSPEAHSWLKFSTSRETSRIEGPDLLIPTTRVVDDLWPERDSVQFRHSRRFGPNWEASSGIEWARRRDDGGYQRWARPTSVPSAFGEDRSTDVSELAYASLKAAFSPFAIQADVTRTRLGSDTVNLYHRNGITFVRGDYHELSERWQLNMGGTYRPVPDWTIRLACQDWTRPVSFNTLAPVATAGIPFDDVMTLAGGRLQRTKIQLEWEKAANFTTAWFDHREINNLEFSPFGPDNATTELADLSLLEQRSIQSLNADMPEAIPRFGSGTVEEWGLSHEHLLSDALSLHLRYRSARSVNSRWFQDNELPYVPAHQGAVGLTWRPAARWSIQGHAIYRGDRYADEANTQLLQHGWEGTVLTSWQSYRKDWQVDVYARSLFSHEQPIFYGTALSFRF
ncbi:MAG: FecR domain-containing protein [Pseudomonadota bacterium]